METALNVGVIDQELWSYQDYTEAVKLTNRRNKDEDTWRICLEAPFNQSIERNLVKFSFESVKSIFLADQGMCELGKKCSFSKASLILNALEETKSPVIISVPVESTGWPISGVVENKLNNPKGFHAITIYGYDPPTNFFLFKNTWGSGWGEHGHGRISGTYVEKYGSEAWVGVGKRLLAFTK
jgi:hypothetical protein